jgi:hypothetical protein
MPLDLPQSTVCAPLAPKIENRRGPFLLPPRPGQLSPADRRLVLDHVDRLIAKQRAATDAAGSRSR